MYSFLMKSGTPDIKPWAHTVAKVFPENRYEWFTYRGAKPVVINYRGKDVEVSKGSKFGVRRSVNGKDIRLVFKDEPSKVYTLTLEQAEKLAKAV